jgi:hypothetical protein
MKTAVELFYDELLEKVKEGGLEAFYFYIRRCYNKSKIKEKEQIIDAYYGNIDGVYGYREAGEEYYNETYNK